MLGCVFAKHCIFRPHLNSVLFDSICGQIVFHISKQLPTRYRLTLHDNLLLVGVEFKKYFLHDYWSGVLHFILLQI